jgi:acetamidase/formamidase
MSDIKASHVIPASAETIHWGFFDSALPPVCTIKSGETVTINSISGGPDQLPTSASFDILPEHRGIIATLKPKLGLHILTGPVAVEGAEPGDMLEVRIEKIELRQNWGYNLNKPLFGTLPEDFPVGRIVHIPLDRKRMIATMPWGTEIPLAPFFGVMGVAPPPNYGAISTVEPREHGGNIDNKELVAGTTIYFPVWQNGALFSAGDGHAAQGDGEVNLTAIETALSGTFTLILHKGNGLRFPRAETDTHFIAMGMDADLDDAAKQALREMIAWIGELSGLSAADAYMLCSLACDLRVTQLVDGNKGIHAMLAKSLLPNHKPYPS